MNIKFQVLTVSVIVFLIINLLVKLGAEVSASYMLNGAFLKINTKLTGRQEIGRAVDFNV